MAISVLKKGVSIWENCTAVPMFVKEALNCVNMKGIY
jgi:hypothetical protein